MMPCQKDSAAATAVKAGWVGKGGDRSEDMPAALGAGKDKRTHSPLEPPETNVSSLMT